MDEKLLRHMAVNSVALMLVVVLISVVISHYDKSLIYADSNSLNGGGSSNQEADKGNFLLTVSGKAEGSDSKTFYDGNIQDKLGDKYLVIKKPDKSQYTVNIEDLYMDRSVRLTISGLEEETFDGTSLVRINQDMEFTGMPGSEVSKRMETSKLLIPKVISASGKIKDYGTVLQNSLTDPVKDYSINYKQEENTNRYTATITIALDFIYAPVLYQDETYIYVDLRRPKEVYDRIIVIDAGHGGKDCGTFSKGEQYYEKDMNLKMILKLKEILDQEDFKVYYTRTGDNTIFLNPRVNFANDVEADLFISLHCNSSESAQPYGSEVLYNENQQGSGFLSEQLAKIALEEITKVTHRVNRGLVPGSEMVIVGKSKVPVVLIEVAFMSNQEDLNFLLKDQNQRAIAEAVNRVILRSFDNIKK
jgi:N-acetylmuramoyl-L-alanine amidase